MGHQVVRLLTFLPLFDYFAISVLASSLLLKLLSPWPPVHIITHVMAADKTYTAIKGGWVIPWLCKIYNTCQSLQTFSFCSDREL